MNRNQKIDRTIALFYAKKKKLEADAAALEKLRTKVLIPLARLYGFKRRRALLLKGAHNEALVIRDFEVVLTSQELAAKLPRRLRRIFLAVTFSPSPQLRLLAKNSVGKPEREMRTFLKKAVKVKRHWRVARLDVRSSK